MIRTVDAVVLGGGPGGLNAATTLALRGLDVVVVNHGHLMGYGIEGRLNRSRHLKSLVYMLKRRFDRDCSKFSLRRVSVQSNET